jgi:hypothetical protein
MNMFTKTIVALILTPLASVAFGTNDVHALSITPYQQQTSKENPRPLPQLHVGDYFVYGNYDYDPTGTLIQRPEASLRVVREEKTQNGTMLVITGSMKEDNTSNSIFTAWQDQNSGLWVRYESESNYSVPVTFLLNNHIGVKAVRGMCQ